jgi:hypothetical protein
MRPGKACSGKYQTFFGLADNAGFQRSFTNSVTCIWVPPCQMPRQATCTSPPPLCETRSRKEREPFDEPRRFSGKTILPHGRPP